MANEEFSRMVERYRQQMMHLHPQPGDRKPGSGNRKPPNRPAPPDPAMPPAPPVPSPPLHPDAGKQTHPAPSAGPMPPLPAPTSPPVPTPPPVSPPPENVWPRQKPFAPPAGPDRPDPYPAQPPHPDREQQLRRWCESDRALQQPPKRFTIQPPPPVRPVIDAALPPDAPYQPLCPPPAEHPPKPPKPDLETHPTPPPPCVKPQEGLSGQRVGAKPDQQDRDTAAGALGAPIVSQAHSLTVGSSGPTVLTDTHLLEKIAHFDRERIPERVVHAKGAGAFGTFTSYGTAAPYTMAAPLQEKGKQTPVFCRFSTVIGGKGSADTARDPRGFAVKFYTEDGNWDIVGNHIPVFFIRDAMQFPDLIHSLKPDPVTNLRIPERFWDFASLLPETTHMITWLYSDYGTVGSYRTVDGFSVNTYHLINAEGEIRLAKFHWKSQQGIRSLTRQQAETLAGVNPDCALEDLHCAIAAEDYPRWELCLQVMTFEQGDCLAFDPLDDTKTWDETLFPLIPVGMMELNRNPENFFAQVEQAAFCPANRIPGVDFSADKMLQGRVFSYSDTQRHRIGANFAQLPINRPIVPPANGQQDGPMAYDYSLGSVNYHPNRLSGNRPMPASALNRPGAAYGGELVREPIPREDNFTQAGERYRSYTAAEQRALCENIAAELCQCRESIIDRALENFRQADEGFAAGVRAALQSCEAE